MLKSVRGNLCSFFLKSLAHDQYLYIYVVNERQASPSKNVYHDSMKCDKHRDTDNSRFSEEIITVSHPEKWRHYVTKTGRLTGYLNKTRNCTSSSKSERKEVWKPAFSLNTTSSNNTNYPSLNQSANYEISSYGLNEKTKTRTMDGSGDDSKTSDPVKGWLVLNIPSYGPVVIYNRRGIQ